jgi:hypothetical protein
MTILTLFECVPIVAYGDFWSNWDLQSVLFHGSVVAVAGFFLWLGVTTVGRMRENRDRFGRSPQALFLDLCRVHRLSRIERQMLTVVSQSLPTERCCQIFVDAQVLHHFAHAHPADADGCLHLVQRLFGAA